MRAFLLLLFLILHHHLQATPVDIEDDLPPFLRGIGWRNVEKELSKDMSLSPFVRPISYDIDLNVAVRGYGGAKRSTFDGSILIELNVTSPIAKIELHSFGLNITKAALFTSSSFLEISEIRYNRKRETVLFTLPEVFPSSAEAYLEIHYNGTAVMRGVGLFESWTDPEDKSKGALPTISLATFCEPTGARRWMPCFDEPDKKATFRLRLTHPTELTAYSNTAGETKVLDGGLSQTTFHHTVPLPTYAVALALTKQESAEIEHEGKKIRVIGRNRVQVLHELANSMDVVRSKRVFQNVTFFPEKTDWLMVADHFGGAMENPGLITSNAKAPGQSTQIHELIHMYFGNLVTLNSWEQVWINEGFTTFFQSGGHQGATRRIVRTASMFEAAIHQKFSYSRSQYTFDHIFGNYHAAQLINLIGRFIGEDALDRVLNRYLVENSYKNGDSEMMIRYLSAENYDARAILEDWVYQPGVALLTVEEENGRAIVQQRRFMRTDFVQELRDTKTRWTIPLYYTINGVEHMAIMRPEVDKFVLEIPVGSVFAIDETYPYLYAVDYINRPKQDDGLSELIALANNTDQNTKMSYEFKFDPDDIKRVKTSNKLVKDKQVVFCETNARNKSRGELWNEYLVKRSLNYLLCDETLEMKENARRWALEIEKRYRRLFISHSLSSVELTREVLHELLVTNELPVRNIDRSEMAMKINIIHSGILLDLLTEETSNIDYLDQDLWFTIVTAAQAEEAGMEKLLNVIRSNPSFAANAYHKITSIFEHFFYESEIRKRMKRN